MGSLIEQEDIFDIIYHCPFNLDSKLNDNELLQSSEKKLLIKYR